MNAWNSWLRSLWKWVTLVGANILVFLLLLGAAELVTGWFLQHRRRPPAATVETTLLNKDGSWPGAIHPEVGPVLRPDLHWRVVKKRRDKLVYSATFTTDSFGRRVVPSSDPQHGERFLIFFGGSVVFGAGVNDNETLPYYTGLQLPDRSVFNYAMGGYGAQQMLAHLQREDFVEEIPQETGDAVYLFIDDHMFRTIGSMKRYEGWVAKFPFYRLEENNLLKRHGSFRTGRPQLNRFYDFLWKRNIVRFSGIDIPPFLCNRHYRLVARIIKESDAIIAKKFNGSKLLVLFPPTPPLQFKEKLIPYLEQAGVHYLDLAGTAPEEEPLAISHDGHPTPYANRFIASRLAEYFASTESPR